MQIARLENIGIEEAVKRASLTLKGGGVVLYPTDTVYGLAVDASNEEALRRLKELKGRDAHKPISILVCDTEMMEAYGVMNEVAHGLAERHLPGPLTLVLPARENVSKEIAQDGTVGIRIPNDEFCLALSEAFGKAFTTTSANKAGEPTLASVEEILAQFGDAKGVITLVVDGGPREGGQSSTVVSCVTDTPVVLREGTISKEELGF